MRLIRLVAPLALVVATAAAQNPSAIEHHPRYAVRVAGQSDAATDLLDRSGFRAHDKVTLRRGGEWPFERSGGANAPVQSLALGAGPNRRVLTRQR